MGSKRVGEMDAVFLSELDDWVRGGVSAGRWDLPWVMRALHEFIRQLDNVLLHGQSSGCGWC